VAYIVQFRPIGVCSLQNQALFVKCVMDHLRNRLHWNATRDGQRRICDRISEHMIFNEKYSSIPNNLEGKIVRTVEGILVQRKNRPYQSKSESMTKRKGEIRHKQGDWKPPLDFGSAAALLAGVTHTWSEPSLVTQTSSPGKRGHFAARRCGGGRQGRTGRGPESCPEPRVIQRSVHDCLLSYSHLAPGHPESRVTEFNAIGFGVYIKQLKWIMCSGT